MSEGTTIYDQDRDNLWASIQDATENAYYEVPIYKWPETKAQIVQYFQDRNPGASWRQPLQTQLGEFTGKKPKNLAKRFDPQRLNNPEPRNAAQYKEFGKTLDPQIVGYKRRRRGQRLRLHGRIYIKVSGDKARPRNIDITLSRDQSKDLINQFKNEEVYSGSAMDPEEIMEVSTVELSVEWV